MICPHCHKDTSSMNKLTPRDVVVIEAICEGMENKEIAKRVGLRISAIKRHQQIIAAIFGVSAGRGVRQRIAFKWANPMFQEGLAAKGLLP